MTTLWTIIAKSAVVLVGLLAAAAALWVFVVRPLWKALTGGVTRTALGVEEWSEAGVARAYYKRGSYQVRLEPEAVELAIQAPTSYLVLAVVLFGFSYLLLGLPLMWAAGLPAGAYSVFGELDAEMVVVGALSFVLSIAMFSSWRSRCVVRREGAGPVRITWLGMFGVRDERELAVSESVEVRVEPRRMVLWVDGEAVELVDFDPFDLERPEDAEQLVQIQGDCARISRALQQGQGEAAA